MKTIALVKTLRVPFGKPAFLLLMMASVSFAWDLPDPSAGAAKSVPELQVALDARPTVRESLGVRSAQAAGEKAIKLEIGLSVTDAAGNPESYRLISFDDPAYAYKNFVRPASAKARKEVEAKGVEGSLVPEFSRTIVDLELPQPMKPGAKYYVVGQGVGGAMVTGSRAAAPVKSAAEKPRDPALDQAVIGLRRIEPVGNGILLAEFGPGFSPAASNVVDSYKVTVNGKPAEIAAMGRITRVDAYIPVGWPFKAVPMHEMFLQLAKPFQDGDKIGLEVSDKISGGNRVAALDFREAKSFSPSIKVNQMGYLPDSPVKVAYLGRWLGDFPMRVNRAGAAASGASEESFWKAVQEANKPKAAEEESKDKEFNGGPALYFTEPPAFQLRTADGAVVFEGKAKLVHQAGVTKEGLHGVDYAGENVYELDFTAFKKPGRYFLSVPGVGRSPEFPIDAAVYEQPFQVQSYGVFAQRSGQELDAPNSPWRRVASLIKGVIPTTLSRYVGEGAAFGLLPKNVERDDSKAFVPPPELAALNKDPALLAYWPMNGSGADISGKGHNLAPLADKPEFTEAPEIMPGKNLAYGPTKAGAGNGFQTDGIDLTAGTGVTFSFWVKVTNGIKYGGVLLGNPGDPNSSPGMQITTTWGVFSGYAGRRSPAASIGRLNDGKWHHVGLVLDRAVGENGELRVFIDGLAQSKGPAGTGALETLPFVVGKLDGDESGGKFLDEARVYSRPLTAAEISVLARKWGENANAIATFGGHHDAGDYNPRSHIEVATILMNAYEMEPQKFRDGDVGLPESGNGVPSILDEAAWAMRLWPPLQRADGAVRAGTESNGDPNFTTTVELDTLGDFAFAPDAEASFVFAATFAQAARIWRSLGKTDQADQWLAMAEKAYKWADANKPEAATPGDLASRYLSPKACAAAELLHTTGKANSNEDFLKTSVWKNQPDAQPDINGLYNQQNAAWAYLKCPPELCDATVRGNIRKAIITRADDYIKIDQTLAYKTYRHPYAPIGWGTGAYPNFIDPVLWAWELTKDPKYMEWIIRSCDHTLGANPLGRSFVVGLGGRTVRAPLHNSRYSHFGEAVPGMHVQGPNQKGDSYNVKETAHPKIRPEFAPLYTYVDSTFAIAMNEGTIPSQARLMALFGILRPDAKPDAAPPATKK
ncbi:MAG: glycoside hydrolase family 9 protein [Verrucomicrobiota bacterium]